MSNLSYSYMMIINLMLTLLSIMDIANVTSAAPALFVFGDSLLDVGNNNFFNTLAKANYKPYGLDFPGRPSGRFTNGRTMADVLGQMLGVNGFIPPYMDPNTTGKALFKGVNYASGSAGILKRTGRIAIRNINMNAQVNNFAKTRQNIISMKGKYGAQRLLKKNSLFVIGIGSNDFILYYMLPLISRFRQRRFPPKIFVSTLVTRLKTQIRELYEMDARKFIVADVAPIGCTPCMKDVYLRAANTSAHCYKHANDIVQMLNKELKQLVLELRMELKGAAFVYVNIYHMFTDILQNYKSYGFENADSACCRFLGKHGGILACGRFSRICPNRKKYVFWDGFHPTEAVNVMVAERILNGPKTDVFPMNVRQLLKVRTY